MPLRPESKRRLLDYAYSLYKRDPMLQSAEALQNFRRIFEFYLIEPNVDEKFEYAFFHFFKWAKRLGLRFTKLELKEYFINKRGILNTNQDNPQC